MNKEFIIERQGKSFVLYAGLLQEAHEQGLKEISTSLIQVPTQENQNVAVCYAVVETERGRFTGLGDASPRNCSTLMQNHLIRLAETRAKARALRDAVNVGVAAVEELGGEDQDDVTSDDAFVPSRPGKQTEPRAAREPESPQMDILHGEFPGATLKQQKAIYAIADSQRNMTAAEVDNRCEELFSHPVQNLSRREASQFIDLLKQDKVA